MAGETGGDGKGKTGASQQEGLERLGDDGDKSLLVHYCYELQPVEIEETEEV